MAFALGAVRATYSGWENGASSLSIDMLLKVSEYYGITIDDLIKKDLRLLNEYEFRQILTK